MTNPPESPHGPADSTPPEQNRPTEPLPPYDGTQDTEKLPPYDGSEPTEKLPPYDGTKPTEPLPPYDSEREFQPPFPPPPIPPYDAGHPTQQYPQPAYATTPYAQSQYGQPQYGQPQYGQPPQQPLNAAQFYPQDQPPYGYSPGGPTPPKRGNGPGVAALVLGIVALALAFIPVVNILAFFLGVAGVIVGVVGLVAANRPRATAAWGTGLSALALVLATVMVIVYTFGFLFAVSDAVDEVAPSLPQPTDIFDPPSESPSPVPTDATAEVSPLGTVVELTDETGQPVYEATVSASVLDATDEVMAIALNPDAPAGMQWAMVTIELTSVADSTLAPAIDVTTEYVTPEGDSYSRLDAFALAPEPSFDALFNLEPGESGTGNVVIAIPTDDPASGVWSLKYGHGFDGGERFYFAAE